MGHTALILCKHKDAALVKICPKTQPAAASNSHMTAIYVSETNATTFHLHI